MIKFSGLSHKRENKIDTSLTCSVFQNIYRMYCGIKNTEEISADLLLKSFHKINKKTK